MKLDSHRIEILMAERKLTKRAFSEVCGISAQNISRIIRCGTCTPITAGKLAEGLGVPVEDVLTSEQTGETRQNRAVRARG